MIDVYVRGENQEFGEYLGEFEPVHLPQLVLSFNEFPTYIPGEGELATIATGQFVQSKQIGVFFEIVVSIEDD